MAVTFLPKSMTEPIWKTVDLGNGVSFELAIYRPTLEQQVSAMSELSGLPYKAVGIASYVRDWRGVVDVDGNPVPFSWPALNQLCACYDLAFDLIFGIVVATKDEMAEGPSKNWPVPSENGGETTARQTTTSSSTDNSGVRQD